MTGEEILHFLKDKILRWVLIIGLGTFAALLIIATAKAAMGKHTRILGIEVNIPDDKKSDTVKQISYVAVDTSVIKSNSQPKKSIPDYILVKSSSKQNAKTDVSKKRDTVATQQTTVTGDNAHVVSGNNNQVGVNGNVYAEKELTAIDKINLINFIENLKKQKGVNPDCFMLMVATNSNGQKVASQIGEFLVSKGYKLNGSGTAFGSGIMRGISINIFQDCLQITVGYLQ